MIPFAISLILLAVGAVLGGAITAGYSYDRGRHNGRLEILSDWFDARTAENARTTGVALAWWPGDAPRADGG